MISDKCKEAVKTVNQSVSAILTMADPLVLRHIMQKKEFENEAELITSDKQMKAQSTDFLLPESVNFIKRSSAFNIKPSTSFVKDLSLSNANVSLSPRIFLYLFLSRPSGLFYSMMMTIVSEKKILQHPYQVLL